MLSLCFIRVSSRVPQKIGLQRENVPSFFELPKSEEDIEDEFEGKFEVDTTISAEYTSTKRLNEYFVSSVCIGSNVHFSKNYAFGAGIAAGSGGAIFVTYCTFTCPNDGAQFEQNSASLGGAICSFYSGIYFSRCPQFTGNLAFRQGGAIYFYGASVTLTKDELNQYFFTGSILNIKGGGEFRGNTASELGGAIAFWMSAPCGIEDCVFIGNEAGLSGGAICSINCPLSLIHCQFQNNRAGCSEDLRMNNDKYTFQQPNRPNFVGRGGGAIYFSCDKYMNGYNNPYDDGMQYENNQLYEYFTANDMNPSITRQLYTDGCCYSGDTARHAYSFGNGAGHEILLDGHVTWSSFNDYMQGFETFTGLVSNISNPLPNIKDRDTDSTPQQRPSMCHINLYNFNTDESPSCIQGDLSLEITEEAYSTIYPANNHSYSITNVPDPTTFIYQATPITQLPYKTTSSWSRYTKPTFSSPPTARTVARTLIETPFSSPFSSPFNTPDGTPSSTLIATLDTTPVATLIPSPSITTSYFQITESSSSDEEPPSEFYTSDHGTRSSMYTEISTITTVSTSTVINTEIYVDHTVISTISNSNTYYITYENTYITFSYVSYYLTETEVRTFVLFNDFLEEEGSSGISSTIIIIISVICGLLVFVIIGVIVFLYKKRHQPDNSTDDQSTQKSYYDVDNENGNRNIIYEDRENLDDPITMFYNNHISDADNSEEFNTTNPATAQDIPYDDQYIQQLYF